MKHVDNGNCIRGTLEVQILKRKRKIDIGSAFALSCNHLSSVRIQTQYLTVGFSIEINEKRPCPILDSLGQVFGDFRIGCHPPP